MTSQSTHRNVQGLFISYDKILNSLDKLNILNAEVYKYIDLYLKRLIDESIRIYILLSEDEKQKFMDVISERQKRLFVLNEKINNLELNKIESEKEIEHIINSLSYKVGRVITYLPRLCRRRLVKLRG